MSDENRIKQFMGGNADTGVQMTVTNRDGRVEIIFSKPVLTMAIPPAQALGFAVVLLNQVGQVSFPDVNPLNPPAPPT